MAERFQPQLAAHLQRHARRLYRLACGFGRQRDAEDILQTLYTRWCRRIQEEPGWTPPESNVELFVCVRRVVLDVVAKEGRQRALALSSVETRPWIDSPEESLHAFERLRWILARLPAPLAEALMASLSAGRSGDAEVARELGLTAAAYTTRLFKARRAAEELADLYERLPRDQAELLAEVRFSGKSRTQIAHELGLLVEELTDRWSDATHALEKSRMVAS